MPAMGKEYALDSAGVGTIAKNIESSLKARGMNRGDVMRFCLTTEELLLRVMEYKGGHAPKTIQIVPGKRRGYSGPA